MLLRFVNQLKKADQNTKVAEIEKKIPDHDKYITTPKFDKLTKGNIIEAKIIFLSSQKRQPFSISTTIWLFLNTSW